MTREIYLEADQYLSLSCDIADRFMQIKLGKQYDSCTEQEGGGFRYTPQGQDIFNLILEECEDILASHDIYHEDCTEQLTFEPDLKLVKEIKPQAKILPFKKEKANEENKDN
jgi:hypothetical protein